MHKKNRKQQSFQYGAVILLISAVIVKIIGALFKIPLARFCLGDLGFGYFSSAYDLFTPIYSLAMAGLPVAVSRMVAENAAKKRFKDVRSILKISSKLYLLTGLTGFALMLALIYPFVKITDQTGKTVYSLFAIAPAIFFCCVMSSVRGYYEGLRNMYPTAVSEVIEASGKLILGFGFSYFIVKITGNVAYGAAAAMAGITLGTALSALYLYLYHKIFGDRITESEMEESPAEEKRKIVLKTLVLIAVPVVLASLSNNIASLVDVSTVKWQLAHVMKNHSETLRSMYALSISDYNSGAGSVLTDAQLPTLLYGVRGKAYTLYNLIPTLTSVLGVSAIPVIASFWSNGEKNATAANLNSVFRLTALLSFPAGAGFIAAGPEIMKLVYGSTASAEIGGPMLRLFGVAAVFAGLSIPASCVLQAVGKQGAALRNIAIGTALKVIVNFIFVGIPGINIKGAPIGTLVCYAFIFIAHFITLIRHTGILPDVKSVFIKPFSAAAICGLTARLILFTGDSEIVTIISVIGAAIVYFAALIALNAFDESDILSLPKGEKILVFCKKLKLIR